MESISLKIDSSYCELMESKIDGNLCKMIASGSKDATISFVRNVFNSLIKDKSYISNIKFNDNGEIIAEFRKKGCIGRI